MSKKKKLFLIVSVVVSVALGVSQAGAVQKADVTIKTQETSDPISKYVYGQFIEHLGRCIYGGIWAEMLEDRKFYYPVPAEGEIWGDRNGAKVLNASPWKITGPKDCVQMVKRNCFVGEHAPQINLAGSDVKCGIYQPWLGLEKGKRYTGRIIIAGSSGALPIKVSLVWGEGAGDRDTETITWVRKNYREVCLDFEAGGSTEDGRLEILSEGQGYFRVGTVSLMPADNVKGMRADTLELLKELNAPVYRWPGGNFVSGYDWRDGTGPRDRREPRKNPAWTGIEHNDFGIDEFVTFCRELGTEPLVVVNSGLGDHHSAAQLVQYANGPVDTPMGEKRGQNGHPEPYNIEWWGIGNEMYGDWQLGHMSLEHYVMKHNLFAKAMREVDPFIKLVAVGSAGSWSEGMLKGCADNMDLISEHFYENDKKKLVEHVQQMSQSVKNKVEAHKKYRKEIESLKCRDIRITLDEWNYWYGEYVYGEIGTRYYLQDALGIGAALHEMFRNSDMIYMANYAQTVNVIGCIKTTKTRAGFATTGVALKLYRNHFGKIPVELTGTFEPLDIVAAWKEDRSVLTVAVVNPTASEWQIDLDIEGAEPADKPGRVRVITGPDRMSYNVPGEEPEVQVRTSVLPGVSNELHCVPCSISLFTFDM